MAPFTSTMTTVTAGAFVVISVSTGYVTGTLTTAGDYLPATRADRQYAATVPPLDVSVSPERNPCCAAAVPPRQPPPVALDLCAVATGRVEEREDVAPQSVAWMRHAQSQTRERRPLRRRARAWE
jgi:hypothetical protein